MFERKKERVSFSLLEREDHVRSVCMFVSLVCVCVCVICYHVNQKKGVMEYVIELSGVDPLVELKSAIIKKRLILEELNNKLKESEL